MGLWKLVWILFVMISQRPWFVCGAISVRFKIGSHLHVALGQTLLLEAEFGRNQEDQIDLVTWERARDSENVRISPSTRISLEKDDSLLMIKFVRPKDFGTYKVTVTDSNGQQEHASIQVRQIDKPPKASMASVLECVVENIGVIQWDSPRFTWVVDDVVVTNQMALLGNGSKLNISEVQGNNYTCVISSSLGVSTTHYQAPQMPGDMELQQHRFYWTFLLFHVCLLWRCQGLSVHFNTPQPFYVIKGQSLNLRAQIDLLDGESLARVTWDYAKKNSGKNVTVAEFPLRTSNGKVTLEERGTVLKIRDYQHADSGVYTITIITQTGQRGSAQQTIQEYLAVNHVSVMENQSHGVLHCMLAWGSEPTFTWLHESVSVTEEVGRVSADGASLFVSAVFCGHFTCVVSNKLGSSSATYTAEACEQDDRRTTVAIVCFLLLLALVASSLAFVLWRRHHGIRRERLRESY